MAFTIALIQLYVNVFQSFFDVVVTFSTGVSYLLQEKYKIKGTVTKLKQSIDYVIFKFNFFIFFNQTFIR